jgi:hypothetical protein
MQRRAARARFDALLLGVERYLSQGRNPADLTPQVVQALDLVPLEWFGGEPFPSHDHVGNPIFHLESILRATKNNSIEIGLEGSFAALKPIIDRYAAQACAIYFPYPWRLTAPKASLTSDPAMMVMEFDRAGLARAAAEAATGHDGTRVPTVALSAARVRSIPISPESTNSRNPIKASTSRDR